MSQLNAFSNKNDGDDILASDWNDNFSAILSAHNDTDSTVSGIKALSGIIKSNGTTPSAASAGVDYQKPLSILSVAAAGTAYTYTATPAALDFGTTDPSLTISAAGTYLIFSRVVSNYVGATYTAGKTLNLKLTRTNNTPADITGASTSLTCRVITTVTDLFCAAHLPVCVYTTANSDDIITIYGSVSATPTAGSVQASEASLLAVKIA